MRNICLDVNWTMSIFSRSSSINSNSNGNKDKNDLNSNNASMKII